MTSHRILQHFAHPGVLPAVPEVVNEFTALAQKMNVLLDEGPEKQEMLRKLLESCDWAIRARQVDKANRLHDKAIESMAEMLDLKPASVGVIPAQHRRSQ